MTSDSIFDSITPADLGLPPKFTSFRLPQRQALDWFNSCSQPISAACLPTGAGKTAIAVAASKLLGVKAVYLVATKALQAQVLDDFSSCGMVDVRGRSNYPCPNYGDCAAGYDESCSLGNTSGCAYANAVDDAKHSDLVITNYAYWLAARRSNGAALETDYRPVELLICDEAHSIESQLAGFAQVSFYASEFERPGGAALFGKSGVMILNGGPYERVDSTRSDDREASNRWILWASDKIKALRAKQAALEARYGEREAKTETAWIEAQDLVDRCSRVCKMNANWVWQFDDHGACTFEPIRLNSFTKSLFSGVPRVLLMSASLNEFTMRLLMPPDVTYDYRAWGQVFNPAGAPVYHIPCRKLSWKSTDEDYQAVIRQTDEIISSRSDRKGIIHTVSYARTKRAMQYSHHADRFIWNENTRDLSSCLRRFRAAAPGTCLVTPSVGTGFDFAGAQAEYQVILKFPFPNETQRVVKERCSQISGYRLWSAAQDLVQMCGRIRRYEEDRGECISPETKILTDDLRWVEAGSLHVGSRLLCFDEHGRGRANPRRWKFGEIIKARTWNMDRVRVIFEDGQMITTPNHPWLTLDRSSRSIFWTKAEDLRPKDILFRLLYPWKESIGWDAGWLSGFMDGEGCLVRGIGKRNPHCSSIMISQNEGICLDVAMATLGAFGFNVEIRNKGGAKCKVMQVTGGYREVLRILGHIRPYRLLKKFTDTERTEKISGAAYPRVLRVERLSPGPITSLQTTTHTYVADGMGAHNTFILDNSVRQLLGPVGKSFCPPGFKIFTVNQVPTAPRKI